MLREPADHAARNLAAPLALARRFVSLVQTRAGETVRLVDLGGGTGSNVRFLAPLFGGRQSWTIWERDRVLRHHGFERFGGWAEERGWEAEQRDSRLFITSPELSLGVGFENRDLRDPLDFRGCDGICNSALLDLVSAAWCDALLAALDAAGWPPFLSSLVADGSWLWWPTLPGDPLAQRVFAEDMTTDKGFGAALGYDAVPVLKRRFEARGVAFEEAESPWLLGPDQAALQLGLIDFAETVLTERCPDDPALADWCVSRRAAAARQDLRLGHRELLALAPN